MNLFLQAEFLLQEISDYIIRYFRFLSAEALLVIGSAPLHVFSFPLTKNKVVLRQVFMAIVSYK